jgi:hypothetical protein
MFQGEFAELLTKLLIDHRLTSRDHWQSDGLAKRMVQTVKEALWKYVLKSDIHHWEVQLCWIVCQKTSVKAGGLGMLLCDRCNEGWYMNA